MFIGSILLLVIQRRIGDFLKANMNEEQRKLIQEFEKSKNNAFTKMLPFYPIWLVGYTILIVALHFSFVIPIFMSFILWSFFFIIPGVPYLIKISKLEKEYDQQIEELYTDEGIKQLNIKIYSMQKIGTYIIVLFLYIFTVLNFIS